MRNSEIFVFKLIKNKINDKYTTTCCVRREKCCAASKSADSIFSTACCINDIKEGKRPKVKSNKSSEDS